MKRLALGGLGVALCLGAAVGYWRWTGQVPGLLLEVLLGRVRLPPVSRYNSMPHTSQRALDGARRSRNALRGIAQSREGLRPGARDRDDRAARSSRSPAA